ncbi:transcriptional regulator [Streptomyces sp. NPDC047108]|uniref:transcriptional regulator n=1 Tax=Streptomyces sp. NPDC047108 TaxID=3155025 RepID=UPI0033D8E23E
MNSVAFPTLARLASERATGALLRDTGTLYLIDGEIVHAESPVAPGIDVLLTTGGRLPAAGWQDAVDRAGARRQVGRYLVESGQVSSGELEICHRGALFDAAFFALAGGAGPTRFRSGAAHWLGPVVPVPADTLERETRRRRDLLESLWPRPEVDTAPVVRRPAARNPSLVPRQRALLDLADGVRTPADIARLLGRPAFHTLTDVRRLAAAGHIETPSSRTAPAQPPVPAWVSDITDDPDTALLRRIRDALEARL